MRVEVQILTIVFSFIFGFVYFFIFDKIKRYLIYGNLFKKLISNFVFMIFSVVTYFLILVIINKGNIHFYFLISFLLGCFVEYHLIKYIRRKL